MVNKPLSQLKKGEKEQLLTALSAWELPIKVSDSLVLVTDEPWGSLTSCHVYCKACMPHGMVLLDNSYCWC